MSVDRSDKDASDARRDGGAPQKGGVTPSAASPRSKRGALAAAGGALVLVLIGLILWGRQPPPPEPTDTAPAAGSSEKRRPAGDRQRRANAPPAPPPEPGPDSIEGAPTIEEKRRRRMEHAHSAYLEYAKYPPTSRPLREQPDQIKPHYVSPNKLPLARSDQKLTDAMVTLTQDRFYVVGEERVMFTMACETSDGPAACEVLSSAASVPFHAPARNDGVSQVPPPASVPFNDAGQDGDAAAGDGTLTAFFGPSAQGFQSYYGPLQLDIELRVEGETGKASFDIMYTPKAPAVFTGKFREALEDGSLSLYAEMEVEKPGRYVLAARVDDDAGKSFAYLSFNEEVKAGKQEAKLVVFGKLIRDEQAKTPFKLRDLEGFLLKEDTSPDRELMRAIEGTAHTTRRYAEADFSDKEWQSEEKDRHLKEQQKDLDQLNAGGR